MILLPRFFSLFALTLAAIPVVGWLILVCADFLSLADCLAPQPGWQLFALILSLSLVLPPPLHAWPDRSRPMAELARETGRAVLFAFSLFALFFLAAARPIFQWLDIPAVLLPLAAANLTPFFSCPLLYISYKMGALLLPRPEPEAPRPSAMRVFSALSLLLVLVLILHPFLTPGGSGAPLVHAGRLDMFGAAWRYLALRHVLAICGNAGFVPAWGGCCLISLLDMIRALPGAGAVELAVMASLFALMLASTACLLLPSCRRWLC